MTKTRPALKEDVAELMRGWNTIEAKARQEFPEADDDTIYRITSMAMNHALGIRSKG